MTIVHGESGHCKSEAVQRICEEQGVEVIIIDDLSDSDEVIEAKKVIVGSMGNVDVEAMMLHANPIEQIECRIIEEPTVGKNRKKGTKPKDWDMNRRGKR